MHGQTTLTSESIIYCQRVIPRKNGIPFCITGYYTHTVLPFAIRIVCTEPLTYTAALLSSTCFFSRISRAQIVTRGLDIINDVSRDLYILTTLTQASALHISAIIFEVILSPALALCEGVVRLI